ncbi:uncharacterized protein AKAW2_50201A [Aspergillus luchuensis]|uniref:Uncharacterized protein n=1 Tax=Aspergillus kawachii TaxID=1069201 RepID=A0A7R8A0E0_ASPKA|nr:uncharacterized protein AKAW2_50201A [Aspergillus luchuensis]BCR99859.1 hypothetical protein AKAW2_50201A [Aspergillus luchuensis]
MTVGSKRSVSVTTDPCDNSDHFIFNADVMRYHDNLFSSSEPVQGVGEETLAPLMTSCAFTKGSQTSQEKKTAHQFGLLARAIEGSPSVVIEDPRVFYNITPPSSTFICGSQGSGKSHTLSCILESCLIPSKAGQLPNPLTGIVFHYDTFISDTMGSPCEAAFLSSHPDIEVRVLCAPTNLHAIKGAYSRLNIAVSALEIDQRNLNTKRMLDLMAVGQDDGPMPLYMHTVKRILREMRMEQQAAHTGFDYRTFKNKVLDSNLTPAQLEPLKQRLEMLESFMPQLQTLPISGKNKAASEGIDWKPKVSVEDFLYNGASLA